MGSTADTTSPGRTVERAGAARRSPELLRAAGWLFAVAVVVHNLDHARRGVEDLQAEVYWIGSAALVLEVGALALIFGRSRLAPLAAVAAGVPLALGYAVVHFTPHRSWFSDSLLDGADIDAWTWMAAGLETIAALALAAAGIGAVVQAGGLTSLTRDADVFDDRWRQGMRHPVVLLFAAMNLAVIATTIPAL